MRAEYLGGGYRKGTVDVNGNLRDGILFQKFVEDIYDLLRTTDGECREDHFPPVVIRLVYDIPEYLFLLISRFVQPRAVCRLAQDYFSAFDDGWFAQYWGMNIRLK